MDNWIPLPSDALLSLRRQTAKGTRSQWTVTASGHEVLVHKVRPGDSNKYELNGKYSDLEEALKSVPELRAVHKGSLCEYTIDLEQMDARELVQLLDLAPADGDENPDDWPADVSMEWAWMSECMKRYSGKMLLRWATINDGQMWITGVDRKTFTAITIDEDEGGYPEPLEEIARCWWAMDSTGAPISWAGGYLLNKVAPRLACSSPYNDEVELAEDGAYCFVDLPDGSETSFTNVIAEWIIDKDAEVGAALSFEEFDPDDTLDGDELESWQRAMRDVELGVAVNRCEDLVRERLSELSSLYRDTRDAIANPNGELGHKLLAAHGEGDLGSIRDGAWASDD